MPLHKINNLRLHILLLASVCFGLMGGCATAPPPVDITITDDRVRFHGKGAGAGMMLMSSMGPMGIAIGVAIDEGIGKDIDASARAVGLDIRSITQSAIDKVGAVHLSSITIERYGFVTRSGDNDPVAVQLHLTVASNDGQIHTLKYPEDFDDKLVPTFPLDSVKAKGALSVDAFEQAALVVFTRVESGTGTQRDE